MSADPPLADDAVVRLSWRLSRADVLMARRRLRAALVPRGLRLGGPAVVVVVDALACWAVQPTGRDGWTVVLVLGALLALTGLARGPLHALRAARSDGPLRQPRTAVAGARGVLVRAGSSTAWWPWDVVTDVVQDERALLLVVPSLTDGLVVPRSAVGFDELSRSVEGLRAGATAGATGPSPAPEPEAGPVVATASGRASAAAVRRAQGRVRSARPRGARVRRFLVTVAACAVVGAGVGAALVGLYPDLDVRVDPLRVLLALVGFVVLTSLAGRRLQQRFLAHHPVGDGRLATAFHEDGVVVRVGPWWGHHGWPAIETVVESDELFCAVLGQGQGFVPAVKAGTAPEQVEAVRALLRRHGRWDRSPRRRSGA